MKTFKFALMCAAALALVACEPKPGNEPDEPTPDEPIEDEYVSPVKVDDNSLADWIIFQLNMYLLLLTLRVAQMML